MYDIVDESTECALFYALEDLNISLQRFHFINNTESSVYPMDCVFHCTLHKKKLVLKYNEDNHIKDCTLKIIPP